MYSQVIYRVVCCVVQLFMAVMWMFHELLTIVMFWNLPALHLQEQLETDEANCEDTQPVNVSETQPAAIDTQIVSRDCAISPAMLFIPQEPVRVSQSAPQHASHHTSSAEQEVDISDTSSMTMSNEFIEEAEELIHAKQDSSSIVTATAAAGEPSVFDADTIQHLSLPCDAVSPISRTNSDSFLQCRRHYGPVKPDVIGRNNVLTYDGVTDASRVSAVEVPQTLRETSVAATESKPPSASSIWQYYYDGQSTDEIK